MTALGAEDALNLDGGGSSTMLAPDPRVGSACATPRPTASSATSPTDSRSPTPHSPACYRQRLSDGSGGGTATIATEVTGAKHSCSGLGDLLRRDDPAVGRPAPPRRRAVRRSRWRPRRPSRVYPSGTVAPATAVAIFSSRPALLNCAVNSWSAASSSTGTAFRSTSPPAAVWDTIAIVCGAAAFRRLVRGGGRRRLGGGVARAVRGRVAAAGEQQENGEQGGSEKALHGHGTVAAREAVPSVSPRPTGPCRGSSGRPRP